MTSPEVDSSRSSGAAHDGGDAVDIREPTPTTMQMTAAESRATPPRPVGEAAVPAPPKIPLAPLKRLQARFNPLADGMMYLAVFVGACAGAALRSPLTALFPAQAGAPDTATVPYAGLVTVNAVACFVYALITSYLSRASWISKRLRQMVGSGVGLGLCGALSMMSMLMLQGFVLLQAGRIGLFFGAMLLGFGSGVVAAIAGNVCGRAAATRRQAAAVRHSHESHASGAAMATNRPSARSQVSPGATDGAAYAAYAEHVENTEDRGHPASKQAPVAYEPAPITDEIPLVPDPTTGDVH